jgi:hypothetical protein
VGRPETEVVEKLGSFRGDRSEVRVLYGPTSSQPIAQKIADLFELAEWQVRFSLAAQESVKGYPYREGIEVSGVNGHLVKSISEALTAAGLPGVRPVVKPNTISTENPKYWSVIREVEVHVGHTPAQQKLPRHRVLLTAALFTAATFGSGIVINLATEWKTNVLAWVGVVGLAVVTFMLLWIDRRAGL